MKTLRAPRMAADLVFRQAGATVHRISDEDFSIQRGIPIPPKKNGPDSRYLARLRRLDIGDSFYVPGISRCTSLQKDAKRIGIRVVVRKIGSGLRIWRVALE